MEKLKIYLSVYDWATKPSKIIASETPSNIAYEIPLGDVEIEVPDHIVASIDNLDELAYLHRIKCSETNLNEMRAGLFKAEEEHKKLIALPNLSDD